MIKPSARRKARSLALQAIYQWQLTCEDEANIRRQFIEKLNPKKVDIEHFYDLLNGVIRNVMILDEIITPHIDRKIDDLDLVELAVLRLATYELKQHLDVPYKVVINEALELTKIFGSIAGYKYINGILDKVARILREHLH
ncbi:MAG: transcription antitermination factor NusB [Coxiellaceae bacterium]|jgi:N utilization substance protein B|nr:transcription antitermination factor NusB [Coxiellaceae bacterium]